MTRYAITILVLLLAASADASPIMATLDGCVTLTDPRLKDASWFSVGTFQAVAFDDPTPGCDPTILSPVSDAFGFNENRVENTLLAWLNLENLPTCGRRQYDLHLYLDAGELDPLD